MKTHEEVPPVKNKALNWSTVKVMRLELVLAKYPKIAIPVTQINIIFLLPKRSESCPNNTAPNRTPSIWMEMEFLT